MTSCKYRKDKIVSFYRVETQKKESVETVVKVYYYYGKNLLTSIEERTALKAHIRQLSASERFSAKAVQDNSDLEIIINKRPVQQDMYMEFAGKTYQIGATDNYEFYNTEIKLRAKEVVPQNFDIIEYKEWQSEYI